jgi:hypothetical protein
MPTNSCQEAAFSTVNDGGELCRTLGHLTFVLTVYRNFGILFAFISFNVFLALLTYWLFRVLNLSTLKSKFVNKNKKGAKAKHGADKAADGVGEAARQGAHPGNRSGEHDAV